MPSDYLGVTMHPLNRSSRADTLYAEALAGHGAALVRLARAYEADSARREELIQELHIELWRSLHRFDERCSLRTWVYRVAHNVAATHLLRARRTNAPKFVTLEEASAVASNDDLAAIVERGDAMTRIFDLVHRLGVDDRQLMLLYLEELDAASIASITGLSSSNVATRIHRLKALLSRQFAEGAAP
ncbi:MAG: sigma-70 family RNA polymerase sigma factor [Archangium sp.]|nr:sigma-70 family RNA polymerase sigma factor [Archangium sp.]